MCDIDMTQSRVSLPALQHSRLPFPLMNLAWLWCCERRAQQQNCARNSRKLGSISTTIPRKVQTRKEWGGCQRLSESIWAAANARNFTLSYTSRELVKFRVTGNYATQMSNRMSLITRITPHFEQHRSSIIIILDYINQTESESGVATLGAIGRQPLKFGVRVRHQKCHDDPLARAMLEKHRASCGLNYTRWLVSALRYDHRGTISH